MEGMSRTFGRVATHLGVLVAFMCTLGGPASLSAQTPPPPTVNLTVKDSAGNPIPIGFRWLLEEDATYPVTAGVRDTNSLAYNFHRSYMPVVDSGRVPTSGPATITIPDATKRYYISVLPDRPTAAAPVVGTAPQYDCAGGGCYSISGGPVAPFAVGASVQNVTIVVPSQPIPTAQISILAYEDSNPINNQVDQPQEGGLGGFSVVISDGLAGPMITDVYGNPLGTVYDSAGAVVAGGLGSGVIATMTQADVNNPAKNPYRLLVGEALIKNLAPGKYGIRLIPPTGQGWSQTSTIEGTPGIDAWVKANEPRYFAEFGPASHHAEIGFVRTFSDIPSVQPAQGSGAINGRIVNQRMSRPPDYTMYPGHPLPNCWIGLNEFQLGRAGRGLYAQPCNADSTFSIPNVPAGTYQLVAWDQFLDNIFTTLPVTVTAGDLNLNDVPVFRWYGAHEHYVFYDANENGVRDPGEVGLRDQAINLRYRDGSIYSSFPTDTTGYVPFDEVFPFFNWLVAEVDYSRFKATGVTVTVDAGGPAAPGQKLNPQIQADGQPTRTERQPAPVLLEAFQSFLGTTDVFEWGKTNYKPGENGGITGIAHYSTTRAEDEPRYAAAETWEPGIPRVPVFLYQDDGTGKIKNVNGATGIQLADVDHYPFGWSDGSAPMGPEDVKRNNIGGTAGVVDSTFKFNAGDAVQIATTDSWDDKLPTDCPAGNPSAANPNPQNDPFYLNGKCYDGLRNYQQVRPGVFDGGYAFFTYVPGGVSTPADAANPVKPLAGGANYIVESVAPKGYLHQKEEDKNVVFGDTSTINPLALPPACVGDTRPVPAELSLFPGEPVRADLVGKNLPLCDRKQVYLANGQNAAADFFLFTEVPIAGHIIGFILNDAANEFNPQAPTFGEKQAPTWIPMSIRDWTGKELSRVYSDEYGTYNALVPSTYTINPPMPSGVSSSMMQVCLNSPGPITDPANPSGPKIIDPYFNKQYSQFCYTFNWEPGRTTYLDTPVLPISAFVGLGNWQLDCDCPDKTPKVLSVSAVNSKGGGPYIEPAGSRTLTITSPGTVQVPDPNAVRLNGLSAQLIARDFGFGTSGEVSVGGVPLENVNWSNNLITGDVPASALTGQLVIKRTDSGFTTVDTITVHVGNNPLTVKNVLPGTKIQPVLDAALPGDLVLVPPGVYFEMLIMTKPVELQGWGAAVTQINAVKSPAENLSLWREKVNALVHCTLQIDLLPGQGDNVPNTLMAVPFCGFEPGTGLFSTEEGAGILVAPKQGTFTNLTPSRIDGFTFTGADQSAGVLVNGYAKYLEITNNHVVNNQGLQGGGIRLGHMDLADRNNNVYPSAQNQNVKIHHNHISENGSLFAPGAGVALYTGSDNYSITDNYVCGNFAQGDGAGIGHYGLSQNGLIERNKIIFNQGFEQTAGGGAGGTGSGAGIFIGGLPQPVGAIIRQSPGAGSVKISANLIQGNNAESGDGGGVLLRSVNGQDVLISPLNNSTWYGIEMINNMIVNNVAALTAGGVALQDAANVSMVNNTIAHNDSTATAGNAFTFGTPNQSNPQPAGIVSNAHSPELVAALGAVPAFPTYSNPELVNNIILYNRSQYWKVTDGIGGLVISGVNDLAVLPVAAGNKLNPMSGLLTDVTIGYDLSNVLIADSATVFVNPYFNAAPGSGTVQPNGTIMPLEWTTIIAAAAALDEGGNFIDVHYGPLTAGGNYHLVGGSPAINTGENRLTIDFDGDVRPYDTTSDKGADEATSVVTAPVNKAPVITSQPVLTDTAGVGYSYQVVASDPNGDALTYAVSSNPVSGLTISPTGLVSWASPVAGTYMVTVTVTDNRTPALSATQTYQLIVNNLAPTITSTSVIGALAKVRYSYQVVATDPNPGDVLTYSVVTTPVASGLTISATTGFIDWISPVAGTYAVTVTVTDKGGKFATQPYTLTVLNVAPVFTSTPITTGNTGSIYSYQVTASDQNGDTLTYSLLTAPSGMTIDAATGLIRWLSPVAGAHLVTVQVSDGSLSATQTFTLIIQNVNVAPVAVNDQVPDQTYGSFTYNVTGPLGVGVLANDTDANNDRLAALQLTNLVRVNGTGTLGSVRLFSNGSLTFTPGINFIGTASFTYRANDGKLNSNTATVFLTRAIAVTQAQFRRSDSRWNIQGPTTSPTLPIGTILTVVLDRTGLPIGTATVTGEDIWRVRVNLPAMKGQAGDTLTIQASTGAVLRNVPVTIQ